VSITPVSDAFTVLESFTGVNDTTEEFLNGVNDTGEGILVGVNVAGKAVLYLCQLHRRKTAYSFGSAEIFELEFDSVVSMTLTKIPNLSDSEPIWYLTYLILNLSDTEPI
jgi:hypothetical protein